jgi:hypothetical protein
MTDANGYLDNWNSLITNNYVANLTNPEIFIGEHGVKLGGLLDNSQYGGIYVSESVLRLVTNPAISYLAGYRLTSGVYTPSNDYGALLEDAFQDGAEVNTASLNFNPYYSTPAASLRVVDGAVNQGTVAWGTTITGGDSVNKTGGTMPALFAQALKGDNGKNYVVITNKSANATAYNGRGESGTSSEMVSTSAAALPLAPHEAIITNEASTSISMSWTPTRTETYHEYFEDGAANNWTQNKGSWSIVTDSGRGANFYQSPLINTGLTIFSNSTTGSYEGEAMVEQVAMATGKSSYAYGVVARYVDDNNYYKFVYNVNEDKFKIIKVENGTETVLVSKSRTQVLTDAKATVLDLSKLLMYMRVDGSTIVCSLNQLGPILTVTDSTFASGKFGLYSLNVQANYNWTRIYRDNSNSYTVYRSTQPYTNFTVLQSGITGTSYSDTGLVAGTTYYYRITAENSFGSSYHHSNTLRKN